MGKSGLAVIESYRIIRFTMLWRRSKDYGNLSIDQGTSVCFVVHALIRFSHREVKFRVVSF